MERNKQTAYILVFGVVAAFLLFGYVYISGDSNPDAGRGEVADGPADVINFEKTNMDNPIVTLKTTMGDIVLELFMDKTPITASNFLKLAEEGFYDGTKFHRIIDDFMIQGGDPNSKGSDTNLYGRGGPGYTIEDEFVSGLSNLRGTISMANIGQPNSGGSQFFINFTNNIGLDFDKQPEASKHPVFGSVVEGMDVVDAIAEARVGERDIPLTPIVIMEVLIGNVEKGDLEQTETEPEKSTQDNGIGGTEVAYSFPDINLEAVPLLNLWAFSY